MMAHHQPQERAMLKKFQDFAIKGNAFDLAVGVVIGAAFGQIVSSLVGDVFMPVIGAVTGGLDFSNYFTGLSSKVTADTLTEAKKQGAVLAWGNFITIVINFTIVALVLFALVNVIQKFRQQEEAKPALAPPRQEVLLEEIRNLLAKK
jgi:large conductance mechanosensitive channel